MSALEDLGREWEAYKARIGDETKALQLVMQRVYQEGQRDMQLRAAGCCGFDVYNLGYCIRQDILDLPLVTCPGQKVENA